MAGAAVEVQFADRQGVAGRAWHRVRLVERVAGTELPRWRVERVQFEDGEARDTIWLANPQAPVRFDAMECAPTVKVRVAREWRRGSLVELVSCGEQWGVAFEDG